MLYNVHDHLVLRVEDDFGYKDKVDRFVTMTVVGIGEDDDGWTTFLCYIPPYENYPHSKKITSNEIKTHSIDKKYVGEQGFIVTYTTPVHKVIRQKPGMNCSKCKSFIDYAQIKDGNDVFICRACTISPW